MLYKGLLTPFYHAPEQLSVPLLINYLTTAGPTKVDNTENNSTACPSMVEIPKNSVNLKEELKAEEEDQIKPKKLGTISLSTVFSSEDSDSDIEVNRKKSNKYKLVEDSSSSEDSDSEDSDSEDSKLVKDSSSSRDLNTSFDIKCEPLDEFVDEESLLIDLILKGTYYKYIFNFLNIFLRYYKILWTWVDHWWWEQMHSCLFKFSGLYLTS